MKYKVIDISEEDYGCEGIPENSELMCSVLIESSDGTQKWLKIADRYLRENPGISRIIHASCSNSR